MSIVTPNASTNNTLDRFVTPPWDAPHPRFLEIVQHLDPDHPAILIDAAVDRLDLADRFASYGNSGSKPHRPDLMLKAILYQMRLGHHQPTEWLRDAQENDPMRWLLYGAIQESLGVAGKGRGLPLPARTPFGVRENDEPEAYGVGACGIGPLPVRWRALPGVSAAKELHAESGGGSVDQSVRTRRFDRRLAAADGDSAGKGIVSAAESKRGAGRTATITPRKIAS